jgi:hypothetical protein
MRTSLVRAGLVLAGLLALAGCGRLNRAATINQTTQTSGTKTAAALQQQLAQQFPNAHVSCANGMIVNVGTLTSCALTGAEGKSRVRFTFRNSSGEIAPASVKAS